MNSDEEKNKISVSPSHGWSPHTAALLRRRKFDQKTDKSKLHSSLGVLNLDDDDDFEILPSKPKSAGALSGSSTKSRRGSRGSSTPSKTKSVPRSSHRSKSPSLLRGSTKPSRSRSTNSKPSKLPKSPTKVKNPKEIITQDDIPLDILEKLAILTDETAPLKERCQLEVDMLKDPFQKQIMVDFRHTFDRKAFLSLKNDFELKEEAKMHRNYNTEQEKERVFRAEVQAKRQKEVEAEIAKAEREAKVADQARKHAVKSIAEGMEQVRKDAEKTVQVASVSRMKKKQEEQALQAELEHFRKTEGKYMHEAQRALKEARIQQKYCLSDD
ncbi:MAG: hypothetical protein SGILL_008801 [Bacillariaceae sp.]